MAPGVSLDYWRDLMERLTILLFSLDTEIPCMEVVMFFVSKLRRKPSLR